MTEQQHDAGTPYSVSPVQAPDGAKKGDTEYGVPGIVAFSNIPRYARASPSLDIPGGATG